MRGAPRELPEIRVDEGDEEEKKGDQAGYDRNEYWSKFIKGYNEFARNTTKADTVPQLSSSDESDDPNLDF